MPNLERRTSGWPLRWKVMRRAEPSFALLLLLVVVLGSFALAIGPPPRSTAVPVTASATSVTLSENGLAPATLSLTWTQTTDTCFTSYDTEYSETSSSGPWTSLGAITTSTITSTYIYGLTPGAGTWWRIADTDCSALTAYSNVLAVTQPSVAVLSAANVGAAVADLSWTNAASYGGMVAFSSYRVEASTGGAFVVLATITSASTRTYHASGLTPSTPYTFYVNTTDRCNGCAGALSSSTASNTVSATTAASLAVTVAADYPATDVGVPVTLTCYATGGVPPFTYAWTFGDGTSGSGDPVTHTYTSAATRTAACTATDAVGEHATKTFTEVVHAPPSVVAAADASAVPVGATVTFTASVVGGTGNLTYLWDFGDGTTGTGATVTHAYGSPGNYTASVTVTDGVSGRNTADAGAVLVQGTSPGAFFGSAGGIALIVVVVAAAIVAVVLLVRRRNARRPRPGTGPVETASSSSVVAPSAPAVPPPSVSSPPNAPAPLAAQGEEELPDFSDLAGPQAPATPAGTAPGAPPTWTPPGSPYVTPPYPAAPYAAPRLRPRMSGLEMAGFIVFLLGVLYMIGATAFGGSWVDDLIAAFIMFVAVILYGLAALRKRRPRPTTYSGPYGQPPSSPPLLP